MAPIPSSRRAETSSNTFTDFMTLFMSTFAGAQSMAMIFGVFGSSTASSRRISSPQLANSATEYPVERPSRSTCAITLRVAWPFA
jgi:hypothetical protein